MRNRRGASCLSLRRRGLGRGAARVRAGRSAAPPTARSSPRSTRPAPTTPRPPSPRRAAAFDAGPWPHTSARERGDLLLRVADLLERDSAEVARGESSTPASASSRASTTSTTWSPSSATTARIAAENAGRVVDTGRADVRQPRGARAGRRLRADHALELPAAAGLLEGRPLPRRRQHLRAQAERADAAHRDPPDAAARGGRAARPASATSSSAPAPTPAPRWRRTRASTWSPSPAAW